MLKKSKKTANKDQQRAHPPQKWTLSGQTISEVEAEVLVIGTAKPFKHQGALGYLNHTLDLVLERLGENIQGEKGERVLINTHGRWRSPWILLFGLGELEDLTPENLRRELEHLAKDLKALNLGTTAFLLPGYDPYKWGSPEESARILIEALPQGGIIVNPNRKIQKRLEALLQTIPQVEIEEVPEKPPEVTPPLPPLPVKEEPPPRVKKEPPPRREPVVPPIETPAKTPKAVERVEVPPGVAKAIPFDLWSALKFRILDRYIASEVLSSFSLGIVIFILLLFLGRMADLLNLLRGGSPFLILNLVLAITMATLSMAIPPAFFFGTIMAVSRLSTDSELIAMESLGMSLKRIATPVLTLSAMVTVIATLLALYITPLANQALQGTLFRIVTSSPQMGIKEGEFMRLSKGLWVYCSHSRNKQLEEVLLYDERGMMTKIVTAEEGQLKTDPEQLGITLLLKNGEILSIKKKDYHLLTFNRYSFLLSNLGSSLKGGTKRELTLPRLLERLKRDKERGKRRYLDTLNHLHKRFSLPFSTLIFALLALSLGTFLPRAEKWTGLLTAFGIFLLYYVLLTLSQNLAMKGLLPPFLGAWFPNIALGLAGATLLWIKSEKVGT